jgi:hypothetical protein
VNFSIAAQGMQNADAAFETAANRLTKAFQSANNPLTEGSTIGDSVSLSTAMAGLAKSNLDFTANVKMELVDSEMSKSTLSVVG